MKNIGLKKVGVLLTALLLFAGCGQESLFQDLSERDANEILVVLYKRGIDAQKLRVEDPQKVTYSIQVPKDHIQEAREILVENDLPRKKELGFSGICKEKGLIPTPEEEKCRKLLALKGEIINSLERVPGVIDADVVLNIPEVSEFADEGPTKKPTASAVIRVKKDVAGYEVRESSMQRFISNAVENLDPRNITVIISHVEPTGKILAGGPQAAGTETAPAAGLPGKMASIAGMELSEGSLQRFKIYAVAMLLILIGVSVALILNVLKLTKMRQELKVYRAQGGADRASGTPLLQQASQGDVAQLKSGEGEKAPTSPPAPQA